VYSVEQHLHLTSPGCCDYLRNFDIIYKVSFGLMPPSTLKLEGCFTCNQRHCSKNSNSVSGLTRQLIFVIVSKLSRYIVQCVQNHHRYSHLIAEEQSRLLLRKSATRDHLGSDQVSARESRPRLVAGYHHMLVQVDVVLLGERILLEE
jgi:hypothetical protein